MRPRQPEPGASAGGAGPRGEGEGKPWDTLLEEPAAAAAVDVAGWLHVDEELYEKHMVITKKLEQHLAAKKKQAETKEKNHKATQTKKVLQQPTLNKASQTNTRPAIDMATQTNTQDDAADAADQAEPAPKKARVSNAAWLWRCQPFYLNAIVDYGRDSEGNESCLSIRDIVDGPVQEMLLAGMRFDLPWLVAECPVMKTMKRITILIGDPLNKPEKKVARVKALRQAAGDLELHGPTVTVDLAPLGDAFATFHPKLFLLTYADRIRVCISSANFTYGGWWRKNQAIYVQDFPRKQPQQGSQPPTDMEMEDELVAFLRATTKAGDWCDKIRQFDYSTAIGKIVASVPGTHAGPDLHCWGHMRMRRLLESQPDPQGLQDQAVVCQVASLGSLDEDWIEEFIGSLCVSPSHPEIAADIDWKLILPTVDEVRTHWRDGRPARRFTSRARS
ncbi:unnamed protein product [Vitrella brassicaformis CCMP3155]|uniref:Uncharacterized protein n=2 Tax=Vitrella brassicaformis TaxID=1169539 RepID=A0A0G4G5J9_VITBC|nr:unnamed protein product [Vitrella brassicaformis CCMP3155]|eukprot:CEM23743.1 unnamed protein product [Vitrella brassicaformis CCMP3155]